MQLEYDECEARTLQTDRFEPLDLVQRLALWIVDNLIFTTGIDPLSFRRDFASIRWAARFFAELSAGISIANQIITNLNKTPEPVVPTCLAIHYLVNQQNKFRPNKELKAKIRRKRASSDAAYAPPLGNFKCICVKNEKHIRVVISDHKSGF